jgi:hypothetical protein
VDRDNSEIQETCNQTLIQSGKANINSKILGMHGADNVEEESKEARINEDIQSCLSSSLEGGLVNMTDKIYNQLSNKI